MAISRWAPFSALTSLEREMQNFERELHSLLGRIGGAGEEVAWRPDTDVYREGETLVVRAGTLDDSSAMKITMNIWTRSARPWAWIDPASKQHPGQPEAPAAK